MKKVLTFIFQFILTFGGMYCIYLLIDYISTKNEEKIDKYGKITICEVIKQGYLKGSYVDVLYYVEQKKFTKRTNTYFSSIDYIPIGEKYLIKYDSISPQNAYVMFDYPVFEKNELTLSVSGKIEKMTDKNVCFYSYYVGDKRFERFQKLPDNVATEIGKIYIVEYLVNDPLRSIIHVK